jgi:hypothetical protein
MTGSAACTFRSFWFHRLRRIEVAVTADQRDALRMLGGIPDGCTEGLSAVAGAVVASKWSLGDGVGWPQESVSWLSRQAILRGIRHGVVEAR